MWARTHLSIGLRLKGFQLRQFYDWRTQSDSIFAQATFIGSKRGSPLAVVRLSGPRTAHVLRKVTKRVTSDDRALSKNNITNEFIKPRFATLSRIFDPKDDDLIDTGLVLWFPGPQSYTGEDSAEFHVHGSQAITRRLLTALSSFDRVRPAEPGEFTRRAVANAKLDLIQAESLADLIASQTDQQRKLALRGLTGSTKSRYEGWINRLITILAHLEASIDFGEDELIGEQQVVGECIQELETLSKQIADFISMGSRCKDMLDSGVQVVILGKPNAGKSTFMNILCRQEKSIVSGMSGTTRDLIEHSFELGGHKLILKDTAGLKDINSQLDILNRTGSVDNHDDIEREGIKRALEAAKNADLIIYLIDINEVRARSLNDVIAEDLSYISQITSAGSNRKSVHLVLNKMDLNQNVADGVDSNEAIARLRKMLPNARDVSVATISCQSHTNIDATIAKIASSLDMLHKSSDQSRDNDMEYVNERHLSLLRSTSRHLDQARSLTMNRIDEMAQHVRESVDYLSRIVGKVDNEQVIDIIFKDFCIGK